MSIATFTRRFLSTTMLVAAMVLVFTLCAAAQQNLVYINANITGTNQNGVIALVNDGAGNLTPLAGSPFLTNGTGVGPAPSGTDAQWDSDQEVMINSAGTLLFAVNGHSNTIASFTINANGTLTPNAGSPFASGGTQPASIGYRDNALGNGVSMAVVVNKDSDPLQTATTPNYTAFSVSAAGKLSKSASNFVLPAGSSPAMALFRPTGANQFFGLEFMHQTVTAYSLTRAGVMSVINTSTPPGSTPVVVGGVAIPNTKGFYVGLPAQHQVGVYSYNTSGSMTFLKTVNNTGMAICWLSMNAAGTRLYTSETASGTISVYDTTNTKTPVLLQHLSVSGTGALPAHQKVDPTGKFLYVLDRVGVLHVFDIAADGTVAENHTPFNLGLPSGTVPLGVSVLMK